MSLTVYRVTVYVVSVYDMALHIVVVYVLDITYNDNICSDITDSYST
jgi:hypothetical protein